MQSNSLPINISSFSITVNSILNLFLQLNPIFNELFDQHILHEEGAKMFPLSNS